MILVAAHDARDATILVVTSTNAIFAQASLAEHGTGATDEQAVEQALIDSGFTRVGEWVEIRRADTHEVIDGTRMCQVTHPDVPHEQTPTKSEGGQGGDPDQQQPEQLGHVPEVPNRRAAALVFLDTSRKAAEAKEWTTDITTGTVAIWPVGECQHRVTICGDCVQSWASDYIIALAPEDTPIPEVDPDDLL